MGATFADPVIVRTLGAAVAVVLLVAAVAKLRDREVFAATIDNYRLLPPASAPAVALVLPLAEIAAALASLYGPTRIWGALGAAALLSLFAAAIAVNVVRGRFDFDCGCGGGEHPRLSWALVVRNGVLAVAALAAFVEGPHRPFEAIDALTVAGGTAALVTLYHFSNLLLANAPRLAGLERHP